MRYLIELMFPSGVHFGSDVAGYGVEDVQGFAHSDTIFSALINTLASARYQFSNFKWLKDFLDPGKENPKASLPFKISSFGFVDTNYPEHKYYLPRPLLFPEKIKEESQKRVAAKKIKKINYINLETFVSWQQGRELDLSQIIEEEEERKPFWIEEPKTQHITDSISLTTQIFRTGLIFYGEGIRPFFIVDLDEDKFSFEDFWKLLHIQKFNGLGGRRSTGCGVFELMDSGWFCIDAKDYNEQKEINPKLDDQKLGGWKKFKEIFKFASNTHYLFSLFFPEKIDAKTAITYRLVQRRGWFFSTSSFYQLKRKTCVMFGEGSIFCSNIPLKGKVVDVTPDNFNEHKVYRYGLPFTIPFCEVK